MRTRVRTQAATHKRNDSNHPFASLLQTPRRRNPPRKHERLRVNAGSATNGIDDDEISSAMHQFKGIGDEVRSSSA